MNNKERLYNIEFINVIAIILVILGHSGCVYANIWDDDIVYKNSEIIRYITNYIYSFHMPLFVFLSGYLYSNGKINNKYRSFTELISKKFRRLIVPYLFIGILFMLPIKIIFNLDNISSSYFIRAINEIILARHPSHLWFILMLFNLFIIFYIIEKYLNKNKLIINLLILVTISIVSVKIPNVYQISTSMQYLLYFYIGYIIQKYKDNINFLKEKWKVLLILQIVGFNFDYFIINNLRTTNSNIVFIKFLNLLVDKIIALLGIMFIFTIIQISLKKGENRIYKLINTKLFKKISKNSYYIYLIHQPIMLVILRQIRDIPIYPIIVYNILFWSTLYISFILIKVYEIFISIVDKSNLQIKKFNLSVK